MGIVQASHSLPTSSAEGDFTSRPARILVVDDDGAMRTLLNLLFRRAGFDVTEASNGSEGLQLLSRECFDLVVTDGAMPVKDGLTMISEARTLAPKARFIVHSGSDRETLERARELSGGRILGIFGKPTPSSVIVAAVKDALRAYGRRYQDDNQQAIRSEVDTRYVNPLFGAVCELLNRGGLQGSNLECGKTAPTASTGTSASVNASLGSSRESDYRKSRRVNQCAQSAQLSLASSTGNC